MSEGMTDINHNAVKFQLLKVCCTTVFISREKAEINEFPVQEIQRLLFSFKKSRLYLHF